MSLVKEQGMIDDLQYEEVVGEFKRAGTPIIQILQDFGILDLDAILQVMARLNSATTSSYCKSSISPVSLTRDNSGLEISAAIMYQNQAFAVSARTA